MKTIVVSGSIVVICGLYSRQYDSIFKVFQVHLRRVSWTYLIKKYLQSIFITDDSDTKWR